MQQLRVETSTGFCAVMCVCDLTFINWRLVPFDPAGNIRLVSNAFSNFDEIYCTTLSLKTPSWFRTIIEIRNLISGNSQFI